MSAGPRFLHTADIHLHAPHRYLGANIPMRELDFRNTILRMKDHIQMEEIPLWFIAGDLWEHERVTPPTVSFLKKVFLEIPHTRIFISPGNHDPYTMDSYYATETWPENVTIFGTEWQSYPLPEWDTCVYGIGFADVHQRENRIDEFPGKLAGYTYHMMLYHGSVIERATESDADPYAPVQLQELENLEMDYVALGHIHKPRIYYRSYQHILAAYPGSPETLRASETGERQAWIGEWEDGRLCLRSLSTHSRIYRRIEIELTGALDFDEVYARIKKQLDHLSKEDMLQIHLIGEISRHVPLDKSLFDPLMREFFYVQWVDATVADYDVEQLKQEYTILARFIEKIELKQSQAENEQERHDLEEAKTLVLDAFLRKEVQL